MDIKFPTRAPVYLGDEPAPMFWALADGRRTECAISAEVLADHFGATSWREDDLLCAFKNNRAVIEGAEEQLLTSVGCRPVPLRSGYFRFSGGATATGMYPKHVRPCEKAPAAGDMNRPEADAQGAK